jgi:hypothetical protein
LQKISSIRFIKRENGNQEDSGLKDSLINNCINVIMTIVRSADKPSFDEVYIVGWQVVWGDRKCKI